MKKVIVTGLSGQDGSYMAEYLLEKDDIEVLGGVRRTSQSIISNLGNVLNHPRFRLVPLDLCDVHSITTLIKNEKPDFFINLGAQSFVQDSWTQPALTMKTNAESLIHICEAVRSFVPNCRIYSAGSSEQWGNVSYTPQDISHPMKPRSIYGVSKCAAGMICKIYRESFGLHVVHGILCNHESERRQEHFVTRKITKGIANIYHNLRNKREILPIELGNLEALRDWSYSPDFIDGIWKMINQNKPKDYVLSSGEAHSVREFVELAFQHACITGHFDNNLIKEKEKFIITNFDSMNVGPFDGVVINPQFYRPAEVDLLLGDSTPARNELGWAPKVSFQELVKRMMVHDLGEIC